MNTAPLDSFKDIVLFRWNVALLLTTVLHWQQKMGRKIVAFLGEFGAERTSTPIIAHRHCLLFIGFACFVHNRKQHADWGTFIQQVLESMEKTKVL